MADDRSVHPLAAFGPLFEYERGGAPESALTLRTLCQPDALDRWTGYIAAALARLTEQSIEPRVAVSTASLGLFARLLSPPLGALALGVHLPAATLDDVWLLPVEQGSWPVGLSGPVGIPDVAATVTDVALPLADALTSRYGLSARILRGNIASAAFGAVTVITRARPDLGPSALATATALLDGPLEGAGSVDDGFVRSTCCLYYRIPGGGYCSDCVLAHR